MTDEKESKAPWDQPIDELLERNVRQAIGVVRQAIEGLAEMLDGTMEMLPSYFEFMKDHPSFKDQLENSSVEQEIALLRQRRDDILLAREAINELESHATLQILNLVAHPGQAKVVMGMAKLMLFLKLSEPGQFK